jgi:hypothetical protein
MRDILRMTIEPKLATLAVEQSRDGARASPSVQSKGERDGSKKFFQ